MASSTSVLWKHLPYPGKCWWKWSVLICESLVAQLQQQPWRESLTCFLSMVYVTQDSNGIRVAICWTLYGLRKDSPYTKILKISLQKTDKGKTKSLILSSLWLKRLSTETSNTICPALTRSARFKKILFRCQRSTCIFKHNLYGRWSLHGKNLLQSVQMAAEKLNSCSNTKGFPLRAGHFGATFLWLPANREVAAG